MEQVEVLINLPSPSLNRTFSYSIPEHLAADAVFGKRVLVEFGRRKLEGFVVGEQPRTEVKKLKPILKVLDPQPVFNPELFKLAVWVAEHYMCSLSRVLNTMLPPLLHKRRSRFVIPLVESESYESTNDPQIVDNKALFIRLWEQGEISLRTALKYTSREILEQLQEQGLILLGGSYENYREYKEDSVYSPGIFNVADDMPRLKKRAPRQAQIMQIVMENEIDCRALEQKFSRSSIKSLLNKGYLTVRKRQLPVQRPSYQLTDEQHQVLNSIIQAISKQTGTEFLLHGVTGSGKTEVYLSAAEFAIRKGYQVLVLVPEITLTRHLTGIFSSRIPEMAVLHSGMPDLERYEEWKRIRDGEVQLVLGTRSAVFSPIPNLGLIIIDEEQEYTYKQEENPRYHAREVARQRACMNKAVLVLGSATPAIETYHRSLAGKSSLLTMSDRIDDARLPKVYIADMRKHFAAGQRSILSSLLQEKIAAALKNHEQVILFINRRGYAPVTLCRACGMISTCPHCSVGLTYHRDLNQLVCHYCDYHMPVPLQCSSCGSSYIQQSGHGTQRIEEEVLSLFPQARIERLDLDNSRRAGVQERVLRLMREQEIDILVGTQMVAKGLDFPNVSLVGIVDIDGLINLPDFRAGERAFQLMVQAAGRAGRGEKPGEVVFQTYQPEHPVIKKAAAQDYTGYFMEEIKWRRLLVYPPFTSLLRTVVTSVNQTRAEQVAQDLKKWIEDLLLERDELITLLGPAPCPIAKVRNRYRYQFFLKGENVVLLRSLGTYIVDTGSYPQVKIDVDINPLSTM